MRRSMCSSPGNHGSWSGGMVLAYGRGHRGREPDLLLPRPLQQLHEQEPGPGLAVAVQDGVEGVDPLGRLLGIDVGELVRESVEDHSTMLALVAADTGPDAGMLERWVRQPMTVYTDGACLGNPGPGGWAWAVPGGPFRSGADPGTTNQRMEIWAALEAVTVARRPARGGQRLDLCRQLLPRPVVGGMAGPGLGQPRQEAGGQPRSLGAADRRLPGRPRTGHVPLGEGPRDRPHERPGRPPGRRGGRPPRSGARAPAGPTHWVQPIGPIAVAGAVRRPPSGHLLVVTGAEPPALGGYGDNPTADAVRGQLAEILAAKRQLHPDLTVLTASGSAPSSSAAEAAAGAGVPYVAVLAYPEPDSVLARRPAGNASPIAAGVGRPA